MNFTKENVFILRKFLKKLMIKIILMRYININILMIIWNLLYEYDE
jgi:hypothetical protein